MISFRAILTLTLSAGLIVAPACAAAKHHSAHKASSSHSATAHKTSAHTRGRSTQASRRHRLHGQQEIDSQRVTQIQEALVRAHYLSEEPNGEWDAATKAAMQKYQADQGWQTRLMPDSRALVKLGLGPDYSTAINAKDVASAPAPPPAPSSVAADQSAGFTAASGVNR